MTALEMMEQEAFDVGIHCVTNSGLPGKLNGLYLAVEGGQHEIVLRAALREAEKKCVFAEELGHCLTSCGDMRGLSSVQVAKQEAKAMAFAYECLVPADELGKMLREYRSAFWEIAEEFGVTESFLSAAMDYYKRKGKI